MLISIAITVVHSDPLPAAKSKVVSETSKSNTRHDHSADDCQYTKGPWSTCNQQTYTKNRTLTLKAGQNEAKCQKTKTIEKKCKKGCRYEKGTWSKCNADNQMVRTDVLRNPNESDQSCEKTRVTRKSCKNKNDRQTKGQKRKHKQQDTSTVKNKSKQD